MRITLVIRTFIIAFLLFTSSVCFAANHYIRAGATGSKNGSDWKNAYPSFASVVWTRGDTYYVAGGTYNENPTIGKAETGSTYPNDWLIIKKANATDNSGVAGWDASFATTQVVINGKLTLYSGGYMEVDGVTGSGNSGHGIKVYQATGSKVIELDSKNFYYIHHVEIAGSGFTADHDTDGIYGINPYVATPNKGIHISNCYIHNVSRDGVTFGGQLGTSWSDYGVLYENNYMEEIGGTQVPGSHAQGLMLGMLTTQAYHIIRNSVFKNIVGTMWIGYLGGSLTSYVDIYNNTFQSTDRTTYWASPGIIYAREATAGEIAGGAAETSATYFRIYNNTFYNITKDQIAINANITGNSEVKNNLFHTGNFTTGHTGIASSQYNAFYNCDGAGVPTGEAGQQNETSDPVTNAAGGIYTLVTGAKSIGHGLNLTSYGITALNIDIAGTARPAIGAWDIGAYEYNGPKPPVNLRIKQ
jgi:hypothetical protein